jgi:hypothetical protein
MGFSQLKSGAKPAATTPVQEKAVVQAVPVKAAEAVPVPVKDVVKEVAVVVPETAARGSVPAVRAERGLAVLHSARSVGSKALMAIIDSSDDVRQLMFPVLQLAGGNSGGSFAPIKAVPEDVANQMPQGKKPFQGYILGFRTEIVAWPVGFDDKEEGAKPSWSVVIPSEDITGENVPPRVQRIREYSRKACKNYQFTKNVDKGTKFDFATTERGHLRPALQLLVWLPDVQDIIVVSTPSNFESWRKTAEQLARNADPKTGETIQFPATMKPIATVKNVNGNTITEHVIDIAAMLNQAGADVVKAFGEWREQALKDPELVQKVGDWMNGVDAPITEAHADRLFEIANI